MRKNGVCGFSGENIEKNNIFLKDELNMKRLRHKDDNQVPLAADILEKNDTFGKMFIFLNSCPGKYHRFFSDLIQKKSTTDIVLSTMNFMKNSPTEEGKKLGSLIMDKLAVEMGFQFYQSREERKIPPADPTVARNAAGQVSFS